jgi:thiol-disulfide isomerase/thioredoxin
MRHRLFALTLSAAVAAGAAGLAAPSALAQKKDPDQAKKEQAQKDLEDYRAANKTPDAAARAAAFENFVKTHPKSDLLTAAYSNLVDLYAETKAPTARLLDAANKAFGEIPEGEDRISIYATVAETLAERGEKLDVALDFAQRALKAAGDSEMKPYMQSTLGTVQLARGDSAAAIEQLSAAAAALTEPVEAQKALYRLGKAYEKAGRTDEAIDAYTRSEGTFGVKDGPAKEPLHALYQKKNGSLDGLDAKVSAAYEASRKQIAFDSRKFEKAAPAWELKDIAGKPVRLADFKGKVVVMDFWGSWCPPCRLELPKFQALYDKYKGNPNVVFLGMNWERGDEPEARMKAVTEFMAKNQYTFPVVIDHERVAANAYEIPGFPTVFMIDETGTVRYRNVGYEQGVEQILEAQLESMVKK